MTEPTMPDWQITILLGQYIKAEAECRQLADALGKQGVSWRFDNEGVQWTRQRVMPVVPQPRLRLVKTADVHEQEIHDDLS